MDQNAVREPPATKPLKPARVALNVLALCFALSVLGRGLGESFTVFLKPISENFGWDRAQAVSVYSLSALASGLAAPLVGRLFDRSGPRTVYSLGLLLLGGAFLVAAHAQQLWQFQLSLGLCVGFGIAFIGNVPNSILLGRWFGPRLPTAMAIVYSATGAGVLILLPASQILIDQVGWRGAYQIFGGTALFLLLPLLVLPWRLFSTGSPHLAKSAAADFADEGWTLLGAMSHHAFWALFSTFFFTAIGMYAISAQVVAYLIDAGFPPLQAATAWGFSGVVLLFGIVQLCRFDRRHHHAVAIAVVSELLAADRLRRLLWQHDRLTRPATHGNRDEDLSRRTGRNDLWRHFDRQRPRIGVRLMGRRPDPRLDPQLQSVDRVFAGQRALWDDPVPGRARTAALATRSRINCSAEIRSDCSACRY
jgi:MFS family permease